MSEHSKGIDPYLSLQERLQWAQNADPHQLSLLSRQATQEATDRVHRDIIPWLNDNEVPFYDGMLFLHSTHVSGNEHLLLSRTQAKLPFYQKYETLGGVVRSPNDPNILAGVYVYDPTDSRMEERTQIFLAPSAMQAEKLLRSLASASEQIFPIHRRNTLIDDQNVTLYLSAVQMAFLAIHPFFEANGKLSEDMLFILWNRRPDLRHTLRYPSSDGLRGHDGNAADQREEINHRMFHAISKTVAVAVAGTLHKNNIGTIDPAQINTFTDLQKATAAIPDSVLLFTYDQEITKYIQGLIRDIGNGNTKSLQENSFLRELAHNLDQSPRSYRFADGTML